MVLMRGARASLVLCLVLAACGGGVADVQVPIREATPEDCPSGDPACVRDAIRAVAEAGHRVISYDAARERMFQFVDVREDRTVKCVYSGVIFEIPDAGLPNGRLVNAEHTMPQSRLRLFPAFPASRADLHHVFPVEPRINTSRSNSPFGNCPGEPAGGDDVSERCSVDGEIVFEPPESHKGVVARAMFYVSIAYDIPIASAEEDVLRRWHERRPVTARERSRNGRVEEVQGNRNPFVDRPEWVELVADF